MTSKLFWLIISASFIFDSVAQCVSVGPNNPSVAANNNSVGSVAWAGPNNSFTSNNSRATATALILGNVTNYLVCTGFNFDIPTTAIICGISVQVEKSGSGLLQNVQDFSVRMVQGGTIAGNNQAVGGNWPTSDTYFTYGGTTDLWSLTWTPADINSANFGIAFAANLSGSLALPSARIDHVRITIFYDNTLPIELINFTATRTENYWVDVVWETASETNNAFFTVEQSTDITNWTAQAKIPGAGNSTENLVYTFSDYNQERVITYYRIKQTDFDGTVSFSDAVSVEPATIDNNTLTIFPNPSTGIFTIASSQANGTLEIYNTAGKLIFTEQFTDQNYVEIDLADFEKGIYLVKVISTNGVITEKVCLR